MQSMRSVLQPPAPPTAATVATQLQAAHQLLQRVYPSYGPAVSLRPANAALASANQVSPFCFYSHRPLAPPPPLPAARSPGPGATAEAAPARLGAAGGSAAGSALPRAGQSNEDLTRWEGRAPATTAHASSLDDELMVGAAAGVQVVPHSGGKSGSGWAAAGLGMHGMRHSSEAEQAMHRLQTCAGRSLGPPCPHACQPAPTPTVPPPLPQECLAGLNSDPSSVLECAPLDLSRPLPLNPLDAVGGLSGGAAAAAAAEGGRASPASDGSGSSANLDDGGCWRLSGWLLLV